MRGDRVLDKREFLDRLQMQLADLTSDERREALEYYEEYFADAGEENEADVLISLGSPEQVAEQIKAGLHKADEGMFTENGYREKVESDNPPEIYGRKEKNKDTRTQDETGRESYAGEGAADSRRGGAYQNGSQNGNGYAYQNGRDQNDAGSCRHGGNGQDSYSGRTYEQGGCGSQGQQDGKKKNKISGGMLALLIVLGIFAAPLLFGLGAGVIGMIIGVVGAAFGVVVGILGLVVILIVSGIGLFVVGIPMLFYNLFGGLLCIALGCIMLAVFLLCIVLLTAIFGRFFPWLIREVESFGKYLSRKWSERKRKGAENI